MENEFWKYIPKRTLRWFAVMLFAALAVMTLRDAAVAQDDDPPSRVARLGYMEGSVSFQPAGENDWVQATPNRPMTIGDKIWADKDSRAEVQLGSATIRLGANTGFSFLNLDDQTVQIQLTDGSINVRVRDLHDNDVFEIDTPNQAFSILERGSYRVEVPEDGSYSVVTAREGRGECTGNGQTYNVHAGQRVTLSGTETLNADVEQIGNPDDFDNWAYNRERRFEERRPRYVSPDMVGYEDLDDNGDWRPNGEYGNVWFPRVEAGWAPYHTGHWAWIDPWGWTWVDDAPWGYAPFHYGRWSFIEGRWGWIPGPIAVAPVYAPALVVFLGGGGFAIGGGVDMAWFPLGPREVYVPSYPVSQAYVTRVNISNTTVSQTTITNVYNTTIVNKSTTITNVTYANRNVQGAVTAVPRAAFAGGQSVAKVAVKVTPQQIASAPVTRVAAVAPTPQAVLGPHANTAGHVAAPPKTVMARPVVAKKAPPPPPPPFAARQQALAAHPGQPIPRKELAQLRPAGGGAAAAARPQVKVAPPGKPATPTVGKPETQPRAAQPGNQPGNRPGNQPAPGNRPEANRPEPNKPGNPPAANEPPGTNRPEANKPEPNKPGNPPAANERPGANRPEANKPAANERPGANRPEANKPEPNKPGNPPAANERPGANRPEANKPAANERPGANRPEANKPAANERPGANRPEANKPAERPPASRPEANQPQPSKQPQPNNRPQPNPPAAEKKAPPAENRPQPKAEPPARQAPPPSERQQQRPPAEAKPAPKQDRPQAKPQTPEEKKKEEQKKNEKQPPG